MKVSHYFKVLSKQVYFHLKGGDVVAGYGHLVGLEIKVVKQQLRRRIKGGTIHNLPIKTHII